MVQNITTMLNNVEHYFDFIVLENTLLRAGIILFIFIAFAYVIRFIFTRLLYKLVKGTETEIDDRIIATAKGPMLLLIITLGLYVSGRILGWHNRFGWYNNFYLTIMTLLVFSVIAQIIMILIHGAKENISGKSIKVFNNKVFPLFEKVLKFVLFVIYLFVLFKIWKIDLTPLLAGAGVMGLAIAFAAQESIANIFGGISLFADKAYEIGDFIIVDEKYRGEIIDIGMRSTKLKTRDDVLIVIPNSVMSNTKVINESGIHPKLRVRIDVSVSYDSDLEKVEKVLLDITNKAEYAEKKPEPRVRFRKFGESSVDLQLLFWVKKPVFKGRYTSHVIKDIHKRFKKEKIEMPFPIRDVRLKK